MRERRRHVDAVAPRRVPKCSTSIAAARISTSLRWSTPLGSPDVPEVNSNCAIALGSLARASSAACDWARCVRAFLPSEAIAPHRRRCRQRVTRASGARSPYDHVLETQRKIAVKDRGFTHQRRDLRRRVATARFVGHDEHARARAAQTEGDFSFAEDRHERTADRADAQRRERHDDELEAVRKLVRDALPGANAEIEQQRRRSLDAVEQLAASVSATSLPSRASTIARSIGAPARVPAHQAVQRGFGGAAPDPGLVEIDIARPMLRIASRNRGYEMRYAFG